MSFKTKILKPLIEFVSLKIISPINWTRIKFLLTGREFNLKAEDREYARRLMAVTPYLWLSRRRTHLTSYLISFSDWALQLKVWAKTGFKGKRPKWGYWTHAFISGKDCKVIEAIAKGTVETYFDDAFDCDAVVCLVPRFIPLNEWIEVSELVLKKAQAKLGAKYDTVFNLAQENELFCIELLRVAIREIPQYEEKFADFENLIKTYKNLTPQMLYDSKSFRVVWEVRR